MPEYEIFKHKKASIEHVNCWLFMYMVPKARIELARAVAHHPLKMACLPIPPLRQGRTIIYHLALNMSIRNWPNMLLFRCRWLGRSLRSILYGLRLHWYGAHRLTLCLGLHGDGGFFLGRFNRALG